MARLYLTTSPGARRSEVVFVDAGSVRIRLAAPASEGKANAELVAFLSRMLGIPPSRITLLRGGASRHKVIEVDGMDVVEIRRRLAAGTIG